MGEQAVLMRKPARQAPPGGGRAEGESGASADPAASAAILADVRKPAVEVEDLSAHFGSRQVLCGLSLTVPERRITAIIGPSGCGKTTFLRTLNRMSHTVNGFRHSGRVRVLGQDIDRVRDVERHRRLVGMLFQRPNPFPMSILDNITLALKLYGVGRQEREAVAREKLAEVGLWEDVRERLHASPATLSGGQQQRLCLARALAVEPQVLLLDEPASALDPKSTRILEELFVRLAGRMTLLLVTHNLAQARRVAHMTAFMEAGALVEYAPTHELFAAPRDARTQFYVQEQIG